ncbi:MAG: hypothetical protein HOV81_45240 [Kofleriaceae bacterium]|nr:hypothetical protein [Kofleriaceae bacterium]
MSELFRVTVLRPAQTPPYGATISLQTATPFQQQLSTTTDRAAQKKLAADWFASAPKPLSHPLARPLLLVLDELERGPVPADLDGSKLYKRFETAIGQPLPPEFADHAELVSDHLVANELLPRKSADAPILERLRRAYFLLVESHSQVAPLDRDSVMRVLGAQLVLPVWWPLGPEPVPTRRTVDPNAATREEEMRIGLAKARERVDSLEQTLRYLLSLSGDALEVRNRDATVPPIAVVSPGHTVPTEVVQPPPPSPAAPIERLHVRASVVAETPSAIAATLTQAKVDLASMSLIVAIRTVEQALDAAAVYAQAIAKKLPPASGTMTVKVGNKWITSPGWVGLPWPPSPPSPTPPPSLPNTYGRNLQRGTGELFVIRHVLKGYQWGEVSHVENVMRSEIRTREHRRLDRREDESITETERTTTDEHSLETTSRYELQTETSSTLKDEHQLKAGVSLSAKFGEMVQLKSSVDYSYDRAKEESSKAAVKSSNEVVEKVVKKVEERVREQRTQKLIVETEEKNLHSFDNRTGDKHFSGVYQWIDKVYDVQVWNHGVHDMLDLVVPEPASFLHHAFATRLTTTDAVPEPRELTESASDINVRNYLDLAREYGATTIAPPPAALEIVGLPIAFENPPDGKEPVLSKVEEKLKVPDGYETLCVIVQGTYTVADRSSRAGGTIMVGDAWSYLTAAPDDDMIVPTTYTGTLPVAITGGNVKTMAATVTAICKRTDAAYTKWQIDTHGKLLTAYQAKLTEYRDSLAAAMLSEDAAHGTNPETNRRTILTELKKHSLALITGQQFELFGSILSPDGYPELDLAEAGTEGPYIRFFENAFEWEHVSYFFYPYYWGRTGQSGAEWIKKVKLDDADPAFADFLRSGAARVVVPVRSGFEHDVDEFLRGGRPWENTASSAVASNPSAGVLAEVEAQTNPTAGGVFERSWEVLVPTSLVKLRTDDRLATYTEDPVGSGRWRPTDKP